jgi:hypothetical protein
MRTRTLRSYACVLFVAVIASACSAADDTASGTDTDARNGAFPDASASSGSAGDDSGSRDGSDAMKDGGDDSKRDAALESDADAGADGASVFDAGTCTALSNDSSAITIDDGTGTFPTGAGGAPVAGTYFLTSFVAYPGSDLGGATAKYTLVLTANGSGSFDYAISGFVSIVGSATQTGTMTFSGSSVTLADSCPDHDVSAYSFTYDASAKQLSLIFAFQHEVQVYTLQ